MSAVVYLPLLFLVALSVAGCSGSTVASAAVATAMPTSTPVTVSSLSISVPGAPSFSTAASATTYPIDLRAYGTDGTFITGDYAQQVIVVLIPPSCSSSSFGLQGGVPPTGIVYYPIMTGVCPPGTGSPPSSTAVTSGSMALGLTWNGTPATSSGELEAYATGVPTVTVTFPATMMSSFRTIHD